MKIHSTKSGFTLMELILVMFLLALIMTLSAPSLSRFVRGRNVGEESRRVLALTRYAREQAISESVPTEVWFDMQRKSYGVRALDGFFLPTNQCYRFVVNEDVTVEPIGGATSPWLTNGVASMLFLPDGGVDPASLPVLKVFRENEDPVWIVRSNKRRAYEVKSNQEYADWLKTHQSLSQASGLYPR